MHSRGRAITPFESRGCVVLNLKDIAEVGPELKRGTPVLIGERVEIAPRKDAVREVEERTRGWRAGLAPWRGRGRVHCAGTCRIHKEGRAPRKSVYGSHSGLSGLWKGRGMWSRGLPSARLRRRRRGDGGTPPLLGETRRRRIPHRRNGMGRLAFLGFETVVFQLNVPPVPGVKWPGIPEWKTSCPARIFSAVHRNARVKRRQSRRRGGRLPDRRRTARAM